MENKVTYRTCFEGHQTAATELLPGTLISFKSTIEDDLYLKDFKKQTYKAEKEDNITVCKTSFNGFLTSDKDTLKAILISFKSIYESDKYLKQF